MNITKWISELFKKKNVKYALKFFNALKGAKKKSQFLSETNLGIVFRFSIPMKIMVNVYLD